MAKKKEAAEGFSVEKLEGGYIISMWGENFSTREIVMSLDEVLSRLESIFSE